MRANQCHSARAKRRPSAARECDERACERINVTALARSADRAQRGSAMSCPVSSRRWLILVEDALEGAVTLGVVGAVGAPAGPDDVDPGAGQDAHGVRVVVSAGAGSPVEVGGPGVGVAGVAGEVADRVAELS